MTALTAPHLGGVTVGGVYHGEVCEEGAQVGDHALDRAPVGLGDKHDITYSEYIRHRFIHNMCLTAAHALTILLLVALIFLETISSHLAVPSWENRHCCTLLGKQTLLYPPGKTNIAPIHS